MRSITWLSMPLILFTAITLIASTRLTHNVTVEIRPILTASRAPMPELFEKALGILKQDPSLGPIIKAQTLRAYRAMPGLTLDREHHLILSVGLISDNFHEIVGTDLSSNKVIRYANGAPATTLATLRTCGPPDAGLLVTPIGTPGQALVTVRKGDLELWRFTMIRPSASSGKLGSGLEIADVFYRGVKILRQAHVPILNVKYDEPQCGPFRDWVNEEHAYQATGTELAPGIIESTLPPKTIMESGQDEGDYWGATVHTEEGKTIITSELSAGWYRYKAEFVFGENGTLQPRWGFAAVQNSCTCLSHVHHAYWRFDFDVNGTGSNRVQFNDGLRWNDVRLETKSLRDAAHRLWRVYDPAGKWSVDITPGSNDGTADEYGKGDIWALRQHEGELDDTPPASDTTAGINAYLNGESVQDANVVLWYGVHFHHVIDDGHDDNHIVGPTLMVAPLDGLNP